MSNHRSTRCISVGRSAIVLTSTMGDFTYTKNADMHYMYDRTNGNGRAALRTYLAQFPDRRMPDHKVFQRLYRRLCETRSFLVIRHDSGRQRAVRSPSLDESFFNVMADRPKSSTRAVAHHVKMSHQTVSRVIHENRLHLFRFQRVQTLNPQTIFSDC
ncbi:DUF4817 domain-containing protein [Trichonephila clavipes]|nr:DUF4817 domain-containing protein [Trichonephila clavipes]